MKKRLVSVLLLFAMVFTMIPSLGITANAVTAGNLTAETAAELGRDVYLAWSSIYGENDDVDYYAYDFVDDLIRVYYFAATQEDDSMEKLRDFDFVLSAASLDWGIFTKDEEKELMYQTLLYDNLIASDILTYGSSYIVDDTSSDIIKTILDVGETEASIQKLLTFGSEIDKSILDQIYIRLIDAATNAPDLATKQKYLNISTWFEKDTLEDTFGLVSTVLGVCNSGKDYFDKIAAIESIKSVSEYNKKVLSHMNEISKNNDKVYTQIVSGGSFGIESDTELENAMYTVLNSWDEVSDDGIIERIKALESIALIDDSEWLFKTGAELVSTKILKPLSSKLLQTQSAQLAGVRKLLNSNSGFSKFLNGAGNVVGGVADAGAGFGAARFACNVFLNWDDKIGSLFEVESYAKIETLLYEALSDYRQQFIFNPTEENAKLLNAAYKMMLNFKYSSYEVVYNYYKCWNKDLFDGGVGETMKAKQNALGDVLRSYEADASAQYQGILQTDMDYALVTSPCISYDANGGDELTVPEAQFMGDKSYIRIPNTIPTKDKYVFLGWSEVRSAIAPSYKPGDLYTDTDSIKLYAVWQLESFITPQINQYNISYYANGGEDAPENQIKEKDKSITLSTAKPSRDNYTFAGWSTDSTAQTATYQPGATYSFNENLALYAVWNRNTTTGNGLAGDINADKTVDDKDLIIFRKYLNGESVSVDTGALDVNNDGVLSEADYTRLFQYLTNWNVDIFYAGIVEEFSFAVKHVDKDILAAGTIEMVNDNSSYQTWTVDSSHDWTVDSSANWCTFSVTSGKAGTTTLRLNINGQTQDERKSTITFSVNNKEYSVVIIQRKAEFTIAHGTNYILDVLVSDGYKLANETGASMNWKIASTHDWEVISTSGNWFTIDTTTGAANKETNLKITTTGFATAGKKNTGTIVFYVNGESYKCNIYQDAGGIAAPENLTAKYNGTGNTIRLTWDAVDGADGYYVCRRKAGTNSWGEPVQMPNNFMNDTTCEVGIEYEYMVKAYKGTSTDMVISKESNIASAIIPVEDSLTITPTSATLGWGTGNEANITVTASGEYSVTVDSNSTSWLNYSKTGNNIRVYPKTANYSSSSRQGIITITCGSVNKTVTISQSAITESAPTLRVSDANDLNTITNGENIGTLTDTLTFHTHTLNVRKIHVRVIPVNGSDNAASDTKYPNSGTQTTKFSISLDGVENGDYKVIVYSSNSPVDNDPTAQKPSDITFYFTKDSAEISAPQNVTATLRSDESVRVTWDAVDGADGYRLYRRLNTTGSWTKITDTTLTYNNDYNIEKGNTYYYYVEAYAERSSGEITSKSNSTMIELEEEVTFDVTHPYEGDILANSPIKLANEVGAAMNWTVTSSHDWSAEITKGSSWFKIEKTSKTNLKITTTGFASGGNKNEGTIKFTVNGETFTAKIYQQSAQPVSFSITHPNIGNIIDNQPIKMYNGVAHQTWTINSSHAWSVKSSSSWCTFGDTGGSTYSGASGESKLVLDINSSTSSSRTAKLTFTVNGETYTVDIYQEIENSNSPDLSDSRFNKMGNSYLSSTQYANLKSVQLTGNGAKDIVNVARSQIGYKEDSNGASAFARFYGESGSVSWCAYFVSWCAGRAEIDGDDISLSAGASPGLLCPYGTITLFFEPSASRKAGWNWMNTANVSENTSRSTYKPKVGDLIFFDWGGEHDTFDHVGIITEVNGNYITYIDGNNSKGTVAEHSSFSKTDNRITAYARPNY